MDKKELRKKLENLKSHLDNNVIQHIRELTIDKTKDYYLNKAMKHFVLRDNVIVTLKSFEYNCRRCAFNERYTPITDEIIDDLYSKYLSTLKFRENFFNSKLSNEAETKVRFNDNSFEKIKELQRTINAYKTREAQYKNRIKLLENSNKPSKLCNIIEYVRSKIKRQNTERS